MIKKIFFLLFATSALYGYTLHLSDKHSSDKKEVIDKLLDLQATWQVNIREMQPLETAVEGFLFVRMKSEELIHLLDAKEVKILWAEEEGELLGYLILTQMNEFFDLYVDSPIRTFDCHIDPATFSQEGLHYIEQIAVKKEAVLQGIATRLLNEAKRLSPKGLVAAVLTKPFPNLASLRFFSRNGFINVGFLDCVECPAWPAYQTCVLILY